jgi:hypothetical protein
MFEYFIMANSFAAPFCSDDSTEYVNASTPNNALTKFAASYRHPAGLYSAVCYKSADDYYKKRDPLAKWLCNRAIKEQEVTEKLGAYSYMGISPNAFEVDGKTYHVENPKQGRVL